MSYTARCGPCARSMALDPSNIQVNHWVGARDGFEWQAVGFCPYCGDVVMSHTFRHPGSARELVQAGAAEVTLTRPGEVREINVRAADPPLTDTDVDQALEEMAYDPGFTVELAILRCRYGTRRAQ